MCTSAKLDIGEHTIHRLCAWNAILSMVIHSSFLPCLHPGRITSKNTIQTDYPPCFEPALVAGLPWFVERWKNSFQKTGMFFWSVGEPQYQEANNFFPNIPPHLEKAKCRYDPPPEETDRINLSLPCISSAAILFFWFLRPSGRITSKEYYSKLIIHPASSLPSWQASLGL